jgi:very-short-patch-repair endonuclease
LRIQVAASLIDPESGSILESLTRLLLWRHGLPNPRTQVSVRGAEGWIGRVDFAWPDHKVILECDGYEFHAARSLFQRDRRRWSALVAAGWRVAVVTWLDVVGDPTYVVKLVRDLLPTAAIQHTSVA